MEGARQEQAKAQAESSVLRERIQALDDLIVGLDRQRSKLLDLYLSTDNLPRDMLQQKLDEIARHREERNAERIDLAACRREVTVAG